MDNPQSKRLLKRIEVAVTMQKLVACLETEGGDQAIDRPANRVPLIAQFSIITVTL